MKWFINFKTATKLISVFLLMAIIVGAVGYFGLYNMDRINNRLENMYQERLLSIHDLSQAQISYQRMRINILDYSISNSSELNALLKNKKQIQQNFEDKIAAYSKGALAADEQKILTQLQPDWQQYMKDVANAEQLATGGNNEDLNTFIKETLKPQGNKLNDALDQLITINIKLAQQSSEDGKMTYDSARMITIIVIIVALLFSMTVGIWISRIIANPLKQMVELVKQVADGELRQTTNISSKDETGQLAVSINHMIENLRQLIGTVVNTTNNVSAASQQISASTEEIASGSANQSNAAQTINELFKELSSAINSVAQSAEQASELAGQTTITAEDGSKTVHSAIDGMKNVTEQMTNLQDASTKIGEIIEVIDDIADQTNLLALNAAIEAARAGEQGRGFAVVADEVRKLAERSGEATKQITTLIKGMQQNTTLCASAVEEGVSLSYKTGDAFQEIARRVNDTADKVTEIAAASEQQAAQSTEVLASVDSISATTEEAAASSEETAAAAQSLAQLAEELSVSASIFKVN